LEAKAEAARQREEEALRRLDERERLRLYDEEQRRINEEKRLEQRAQVAELNRELEVGWWMHTTTILSSSSQLMVCNGMV
jgi:hypothetical protein